MTINTEDLLNSILESVGRIDYIHPVDIPNIDLYMDQVTTFMEEQLSSTKRYEDDKILTKTMINNYAEFDMESIYEEVCKMEKSRIGELQDSIRKAYETAEHSFVCVDDEEREQLQKFAFICNLSFDVYVKKQLIEKMVDELPKPDKKK